MPEAIKKPQALLSQPRKLNGGRDLNLHWDGTRLQGARCNISSRTIDDAHRPRIVRRATGAPVHRPRRWPFVVGRRSKANLALCAALAAGVLALGASQWVLPFASAPALRSVSAMLADGMKPPPAVSPARAAPGRVPTSAATAAGSIASTALDARFVEAGATKISDGGAALSPTAGPDVANAIGASTLSAGDDRAGADVARARSQRPRSPRTTDAAPRRHEIAVQLSSYSNEARARQGAAKLHRSLRKVLNGIRLQTEKAEAHGKPVWRVIAGPLASRERGKRLCNAVHHAGQSCVIVLL